jgi:NADH-quinone oxidoreductase subunit L
MNAANWMLLVLLAPLAGFLINGLFGRRLGGTTAGWIGTLAILISLTGSVYLFGQAGGSGVNQSYYRWISAGSLQADFGLMADGLNSILMLVITGVGLLIHLYSIGYMHHDKGFHKFFAYLNLFVFSMLLLVMGNNFVIMFFGWEGVGLCSYLLIGFWYENESYGKAARKAFVMNRIGDLGLLVGLFLIWYQFGTFNYSEVFAKVDAGLYRPEIITAICISLFIGATGKSAQIPLFTWLPDAMAGPTPVSALIHAATMVTAGIFMVVRCNHLFSYSPLALDIILYIGLATSVMAALIGLKQNDIKKVLAYSTVSQLGLMFVALGAGAYTAAVFHLVTHAFFKALLFLGSGSVIHGMNGEQDIRKMGGLASKMPVTYFTFLIGTLAITGFPFFSGFFSKDEILIALFQKNPVLYAIGLGSAFITAFYMFRLFFVTFHGRFRGSEEAASHVHESPFIMTLPLIVLAVLSVAGGLINLPHWAGSLAGGLEHRLTPLYMDTYHPVHVSMGVEIGLAALAFAGLVAAFLYNRSRYHQGNVVPEADEAMQGAGLFLAEKMRVDELYDSAVARPLESVSTGLHRSVDTGLIDAIVNGIGKLSNKAAALFARLQSGNISWYLLAMACGLVLLAALNLFI